MCEGSQSKMKIKEGKIESGRTQEGGFQAEGPHIQVLKRLRILYAGLC